MAYATVATYAGRNILWHCVKQTGTEPKNIGWGSSLPATSGSASANVNLFGPQTEGRTAGTSSIITSTSLGDTYQVTGTIVCAAVAKSITEAALFDTTIASLTTTVTNSLASGTTVLTLGSSLSGNNGNFYAQLGTETVLVTGAAATSFTVSRGMLGSTASAWSVGTPITMGGDGGGGFPTPAQTVNTTSMVGSYGGNMFLHSDFAAISLNPADSISFTFSDTLTALLPLGIVSALSALLGLAFC